MNIFNGLKIKKFKKGEIDLSGLPEDYRDNEEIVDEALRKYGAGQFKFASQRLQGDAKFILDHVEKYPAICKYILPNVCQTYVAKLDGTLVPNATEPKPQTELLICEKINLFGILLMTKNTDCCKSMPDQHAKIFLEYALSGSEARISYLGEEIKIKAWDNLDNSVVYMLKKRPHLAKELLEQGFTLPVEAIAKVNNKGTEQVLNTIQSFEIDDENEAE